MRRHVDELDVAPQYHALLGDFEGGALECEGPGGKTRAVDSRNSVMMVDGRRPHWVMPFDGTRYAVIWFKVFNRRDAAARPWVWPPREAFPPRPAAARRGAPKHGCSPPAPAAGGGVQRSRSGKRRRRAVDAALGVGVSDGRGGGSAALPRPSAFHAPRRSAAAEPGPTPGGDMSPPPPPPPELDTPIAPPTGGAAAAAPARKRRRPFAPPRTAGAPSPVPPPSLMVSPAAAAAPLQPEQWDSCSLYAAAVPLPASPTSHTHTSRTTLRQQPAAYTPSLTLSHRVILTPLGLASELERTAMSLINSAQHHRIYQLGTNPRMSVLTRLRDAPLWAADTILSNVGCEQLYLTTIVGKGTTMIALPSPTGRWWESAALRIGSDGPAARYRLGAALKVLVVELAARS